MFALLAAMTAGGCTQRTLWSDHDPALSKTKYWPGEDSVEATHNARNNNAGMGFGFSQGPADQ